MADTAMAQDEYLDPDASGSSDDELVVNEAAGDLGQMTNKPGSVDRIKKKAKRPSAKIAENVDAEELKKTAAKNSVDSDPAIKENGVRVPIVKRNNKNSRRPRGKYGRGRPKKGGAGGKGTWGKPGLVDVEEGVDDPHDPNYDSDSQEMCKFEAITPPLEMDEIEKHVSPIIIEYFEHGDTDEVFRSLAELNLGDNNHQVLVIAVTLAMERKASHREMTSILISDLYGGILCEEDNELGFDVLLRNLSDLILDTPTAPTILGNFIARAVADDCVPPKYVQNGRAGMEGPHIQEVMDHANALLNMKHGLVKLDSVWGVTGGMRPVKYLINRIQLLIREYISSGDGEEATRCLQELEVPHFHHEFVYEAVIMMIEDMSERTLNLMFKLFKSLSSSAIVTLDQLKNGMNRVYEEMPDVSIDVPMAYNILEKFVLKCATDKFMPQEIVKNLPNRGRKRFVSEGDGGRVKDDE